MANCIFGWPNRADDAGVVFSGGSWLAALPLANLVDSRLERVARSTNALAASTTFDMDFGAAVGLRVFALPRHTLQLNATVRIRGSTVSNFASTVYDTGALAVWPVQWPTATLPTGHPNAATRLLTNAQIARLRWGYTHVAASVQTARYWRWDLVDTGNTAGYVDLGRVVMSPGYQPSVYMDEGAAPGFGPETVTDTALGGSHLYDARPTRRILTATFSLMPPDEAHSVMQDMKRELGLNGQVQFVTDVSDTVHMARRSFLANLKELDPLSWESLYASTTVKLEEVL